MNIQYIGERLWAGQVGNAFVLLAFCAALLAAICYFLATENDHKIQEHNSWKKIGRIAFWMHSAAVTGIVGTLFYMLANHFFEYEYIWHHSSKQLPLKYIFSCFWEGQEGSFLLWSFWHVVLGNIVLKTSKEWETPVMSIIALVQVFLCSMLLGINIGDYHLGSNPFTVLLREHPDYSSIPLFQNANYLTKLDGRGLNPLLQNYWMTIHPPTLFLGFAATLIPFSFAIAALWTKRFNDWQKPALPWSYFGIMVLGTGILMGGAWAYEALSFGGFWAWDPVENASLVPWLTLVGGAHVMIINKNKGGSLFTSFLLIILTFILILYSTFLTRSGILGDSSVHAFTDLGMSGQLLCYLFSFLLLSIILIIVNARQLFPKAEEEQIWSREFWMFVGSLVLLLSAIHIIGATSVPVFNKLFGTKQAPPNPAFYNKWQIPFAFVISLLIAVGQFFKYKNTDINRFLKKMLFAFVLSVGLSLFIAYVLKIEEALHCLLLFSSLFSVIANLDYFISALRGNFPKAGASIAHIGFGMILLGALISAGKKEVISKNTSATNLEDIGKDFSNNTNILLQQYDTLAMGDYFVSYRKKIKEGINLYFEIEYYKRNKEGKKELAFKLYPLIQLNNKMGDVAEPDTKHFLSKDIYTHITYADLETIKAQENEDEYGTSKEFNIGTGDTIATSNAIIILDTLVKKMENETTKEISVGAPLRIYDVNNKRYDALPTFNIRNNTVMPTEAYVEELGLKFTFWKIHPETGKIEIVISEKKANKKDFIVMEAAVFHYINVLWTGCLIMIIGTVLAIFQRIKQNRKEKTL